MHLKQSTAAPSRAENCAVTKMQTLHTAAEPDISSDSEQNLLGCSALTTWKYNLIYYIEKIYVYIDFKAKLKAFAVDLALTGKV